MQPEKQLGIGASLVIVILAFGAFAGTAAIVTKNQFSLAPATLADDGEDGGGDSEDDNGDNNEGGNHGSSSESEKKKAEKASEAAKKQAERARESAKKQFEQSNKRSDDSMDDNSEDDNNSSENNAIGDDDSDNNGGENDGDSDDDGNVAERSSGDDEGMYKDRGKTLTKLEERIAEAEKHILEKQAEGVDVTTALARLAAAKEGLGQVGASFDANDFDAAKLLAKQIRKTAYFTEKDVEYAKHISEELAKIEKRFGQVERKIVILEGLGGDVSVFKAQLASLRVDFSALKTTETQAPDTVTREIVRAFEKRVKRLKSLVEGAMFAYGGSDDDDDLMKDHEEDADDLSDNLDDVAEIESGDDNGISGKVRKVAAEHKATTETLKESLENIKGRGGFAKVLFGPDFGALDTLASQIAAMQNRAATLSSLAAQMNDPDIKQILLDQASALQSEALKLQSYATAENNQFSIFGAFLRLFR